tara:strand:+ start:743 stop:1678 length:936 start_codon:yes stop_codon:yes gene_type:complete
MKLVNFKNLFPPVIGLLLFLVVMYYLDTDKIKKILFSVDLNLIIIALILAILSNIICSYRWKNILIQKNIQFIKVLTLIRLNFEGIAISTLIPIGLTAVELWKVNGLYLINKVNFKYTAPTILLDRVSGLCGLGFINLLGIVFYSLNAQFLFISKEASLIYVGIIIIINCIPIFNKILTYLLIKLSKKFYKIKYVLYLIDFKFFYKNFLYSILNQSLLIISFWLCTKSIGLEIPIILLITISLAIMIPAILPFSLLGFGPREAGVVFVLSFYNILPEEAFVSSLLFGLLTTAQGFIGIFFLIDRLRVRLKN